MRYQLELFESTWPPVISSLTEQAHHLADILGLDHDLAVLEDLVANECSNCCKPDEIELLHALITQRRTELQREALETGPKLFAETSKQFSNRVSGYWKTWEHPPTVRVAA
ncbi:MAG: hypothetical protein C5B54_06630 [Acidobacteria bacterium]|nr:MAG: hypothetical protein C5B54_06630 [Acidobacteriota bacterium]